MEHGIEAVKSQIKMFFTLPDEEVLLQKRVHVFNLLAPIIITILLALGLSIFIVTIANYLAVTWSVVVAALGIVLTGSLFLIGKSITEWNFHWYVITNRKFLEICYVPLGTYYVNDILLDRVKCTEIDVRADGIINELLDMGDINITFDRPTKQEGFVLHNIRSARKLGMFLTNFFLLNPGEAERHASPKKQAWYRNEGDSQKWRFSEEIFPSPSPT